MTQFSTIIRAALYLIGGIILLSLMPVISWILKISIGIACASVGVAGALFIIIGISGISAAVYMERISSSSN